MTMRALGVRNFGKADKLELLDVTVPTIVNLDDILIEVKAISLNRSDGIKVLGYTRLFETVKYFSPPIKSPKPKLTYISLPLVIGHMYAGIISAVGSSITSFYPGDRVYGFTFTGRSAAEYLLLSSKSKHHVSKIPEALSFEDAVSLVAHTAIGAITRADAEIPGGLNGKTVLVPAGLGGVGSTVLQLLKPVFGAGKVITTLSTKKVALVDGILGGGLVDQVIDYTTQDVVTEVGKGTVDFFLDTAGMSMTYIEVVKPKTGLLLTIVGKSGQTLARDWPEVSWWLIKLLDVLDGVQKWRASRWGVKYDHVYTQFTSTASEKIAEWMKEDKLKAIIGKTAEIDDLETVREMFEAVTSAKGAIGKYVIKIV
jgi:NADPH:quinone reductase-like Zn-dependent oxidoreductase